MSVLRERVTWVWLALVVLTCVTTWGLSKDLVSPTVAVVGTFLIAAVKVRYVILDFMELRNAPIPVRIVVRGVARRGRGDDPRLLVRQRRDGLSSCARRQAFRQRRRLDRCRIRVRDR